MVQKVNEQGLLPPYTGRAPRPPELRVRGGGGRGGGRGEGEGGGGAGGGPQTPAREPREVGGRGGRKRGNNRCTEELWAGEGGWGGGAGSGRPIAGTAAGEGYRASIRVHAHVQTRMAACCAPHQRPSVGTGSPGRTALSSIRACSGIEAMTCLATTLHRVVDRSRIAFSIKSFLETDPIPAAYFAIWFSRAKASGPARPYVS